MSSLEKIDINNIPLHVAIIMDGNGRWALEQGKERMFGHQNGVQGIRNVIEAANSVGVRYLSLYAFSIENWSRNKKEVESLIYLFTKTVRNELNEFMNNNIRLITIGNLEAMPFYCQREFKIVIEKTKNNTGLTLIIALNYSSRWEIEEAIKKIAFEIHENNFDINSINENVISSYLSTSNIPDPDILIRTGRENRLSNFLLWQISYTELFFLSILWPDFSKENFWQIISDFQKRERRFGKVNHEYKSL